MSQNTPTSPSPAPAQPPFPLVPNNSLITATPEEGRQLAVKLARLIVRYTQQDEAKRKEMRVTYADDPMMLIALTQTVATEFATVAAANNYWRK